MYLSSRRRSGHGPSVTTEVKKPVSVSEHSQTSSTRSKPPPSSSSRPNMTRRTTTQSSHKSGSRSSRDRERDWDREQEHWYEEQRESFPQYCMSCEKQFVPQDDRFLYCSETCRVHDHNSSAVTPSSQHSSSRGSYASPVSYTSTNYPYYSVEYSESRDIIPRASPSRPSSMHYSPPATSSMAYHGPTLSALRSLSIQDDSPPSPTTASVYHTYNTAASARGAPSPATSYSSRPNPKKGYSSTYDNSAYYADYSDVPSLDRPLPRRSTTYSRPKSIELVTPMVSR
ncbi:hypothetical protein MCOR25_001682 [Pyricularia grisea]|uniref:Life-span regulatory factor domain-containing protein n=1 Tax=Pyricularia grisea TaxID=148305 RepID=A0A6P8ASG4_PYRGI|nr:uncharacterized protein PgNI_09572 [Pyricularia grisea]KAI6380253.1 hypothetical protein MCOR25_001682 [Pyricularia grisea]TLD05065.1 hypothetical protein PgNI_09572 [Pyricularia grisea]